ncbi:ATP-binding protein [Henriciella litoralis]|uniref:ATP-binding protein n=1 Tax=Henriciella litoralis TaxID=568102 RepID=UPI000A03006F|nr:ATP-binding protein [Henriciella litoralis]
MSKRGAANANPTKAFFVRMITRDITLEDCILDLVDNSVDGAWACVDGGPLTLDNQTRLDHFTINISINTDSFTISDNCGGITLEDAESYAFTFGRRDDDPQDGYNIGVYGIGMKRAVFKLGRKISIRSTTIENGDVDSFEVPINVTKWLRQPEHSPWDFDIFEADNLPEPGVRIEVKEFTSAAEAEFADPAFLEQLRKTIARDYSLHLHRGLQIIINGKKLEPWRIEFRQSEDFSPMRQSHTYKEQGGEVFVEIIAGMIASPPEDVGPSESEGEESRSGWYVVCNGRIVLAADKTSLSGWGTSGYPKWHRQYSGFMGFVIFSAQQAELLPLTTTKRSIDNSSSVFRKSLPEMRTAARTWIDYTNIRKQAMEAARGYERSTKSVEVFAIQRQPRVELPELSADKKTVRMSNIAYSVPTKKYRKLAAEFGDPNMSLKDVGLTSFSYAYDDFVGD